MINLIVFWFSFSVNFSNYLQLNDTQRISIKCAPPGRYDFHLTPMKKCKFQLQSELRQIDENWPFLNRSQSSIIIRFQNRQQRRQVVVKWEKR